MNFSKTLALATAAVLSRPVAQDVVAQLLAEATAVFKEYSLTVQTDSITWLVQDISVCASANMRDPGAPDIPLCLEVMLVMMPGIGFKEGRAVLVVGVYGPQDPLVSALDRTTWSTVHIPDCPGEAQLRHAPNLADALSDHLRQHYDAMVKHQVHRFCCHQMAANYRRNFNSKYAG